MPCSAATPGRQCLVLQGCVSGVCHACSAVESLSLFAFGPVSAEALCLLEAARCAVVCLQTETYPPPEELRSCKMGESGEVVLAGFAWKGFPFLGRGPWSQDSGQSDWEGQIP